MSALAELSTLLVIILLVAGRELCLVLAAANSGTKGYGRRKAPPASPSRRFSRKPPWVHKKIIHLKALMPTAGCRVLADIFNRRFSATGVSVGKTYVSGVIRAHWYEIMVMRREIKHRQPKPTLLNLVWAMDLTGKGDTNNQNHGIIALLDHGSRANLCLQALQDKTSITLLRCLLDAIEFYGKPKFLRTDNEAVFTSRLFRFGLRLLGIKHQRTDKGCPWMNGRVERFFGTLKSKLDLWEVDSLEQLNCSLRVFRIWYNHIRPHQNLGGKTPSEVWADKDIFTTSPKQESWFEAWEGLLTGYYLRL